MHIFVDAEVERDIQQGLKISLIFLSFSVFVWFLKECARQRKAGLVLPD
jgi:hypothetical protein